MPLIMLANRPLILRKLRADILALVVLAFGVSILFSLHTAQQITPRSALEVASKTDWRPRSTLLAPPRELKYFTLGYQDVVSDSLWIRVIQNLDLCEQEFAESPSSLSSPSNPSSSLADVTTPGAKGEYTVSSARPRCKNGYVYHMLDAITELTPDFRVPYSAGAIALSVLVDDREGATKIFEKAVARFPDDWVILYRAGYHFLFEVNDPVRAQDLLVRAARQGAPPWVYSLASRLASKEGQTELAVRILEQALATDPRPEVRMRLEQRLTELQGAP